MFAPRTAVRASRAVRVNAPALRQNIRCYADSASSSTGGAASSGFASGAAGGAAASLVVALAFYNFTGVGKAAKTANQLKGYVDSTAESLKVQFKENTPEPNEAIDALKSTAYKYASFVPGGREYVDKVFKDVEIIRQKHGDEVDNIVKDAYSELRSASKNGINLETASQMWFVITTYLSKLASLSVDAGQDILNNHPQLKEQLGGSFDQLKQFSDSLGPEAKEKVQQTYKEIQDVISEGFSFNTVDRIRKLAQEKVEELKKLADKAWEQGYEQVKPQLEKNPQLKKFVEENKDTLKSGNVTEAVDKVRQAVSSGDMGNLQEYVEKAKSKADSFTSSSISGWLNVIPGGSAILPQLQKLRQIAESRGPEAEKLAKETMNDIKGVLEKRSDQIAELAKKAEQEAKKN
ncbi:hypothetical protein CLAFUW4_12284 [Fulvia fulva]|uniref:Uncharacterized protein n=1 Tax=Passalora fulva TaxID=5499 RepID=A0A9Q8PDU8_PASFU|nr:uncharacterized protein CLAFUR5_11314 [Fulvia fulva]KAK4617437.1 hypothetical protein CLAFUR4_12289 [Fulvia fulva]KAK4618467.1 hypothetical protein CLAFUR0_12300 [Fulvia fulva]UJO20629.1 hypothetical protein CLAFUR5_11314 [Fulvia fulva]WPV17926.1 hypothetical protein CLAFUW4_12284 [Fulvia fulva]WPV33004.1 hypothetical protein CLAFUW7_12291 [Fulvia fulva]